MTTGAKVRAASRWLLSQADSAIALSIAIGAGVLSLTTNPDPLLVSVATLSALSVLAFALIRLRSGLDDLIETHKALRDIVDTSGKRASVDDLFQRGTQEELLIEAAQEEVWLVQETGSLIADMAQERLVSLLAGGGRVRAVVCPATTTTAALLALRSGEMTTEQVLRRCFAFGDHLRIIRERVGAAA